MSDSLNDMAILKKFGFAHAQIQHRKILSHDQNKYDEHRHCWFVFPVQSACSEIKEGEDLLGKLKSIVKDYIAANSYKINYKQECAEAAFSNLTIFCQTRHHSIKFFRRKIVNPMSVPRIWIWTICLKVVRETFRNQCG